MSAFLGAERKCFAVKLRGKHGFSVRKTFCHGIRDHAHGCRQKAPKENFGTSVFVAGCYSSMSSVLIFFTFLVGRMISRRISSTTRIAGEMNIDRFTVNVNPRSR